MLLVFNTLQFVIYFVIHWLLTSSNIENRFIVELSLTEICNRSANSVSETVELASWTKYDDTTCSSIIVFVKLKKWYCFCYSIQILCINGFELKEFTQFDDAIFESQQYWRRTGNSFAALLPLTCNRYRCSPMWEHQEP